MSYESVITALKDLLRRDLLKMDPKEHRSRVDEESDRANIILQSAVLERFILFRLDQQMPSINSDERTAIFQFEGPCGSFSSRIKMAQALGIIDRKLRRRLDLIREMRNVAAHAHPDINFETSEIREAVINLCGEKNRDVIESMPRKDVRGMFHAAIYSMMGSIIGSNEDADLIDERAEAFRKTLSSPGKSPPLKSLGRPSTAGKGSRQKPPPK